MNILKVQRLLLASMLFDIPLCLLPELILHWTYAEISLQKCFSKGKPIDLCSCILHIWVRTETNWRERGEKNLREIRRKRKERRKKGRKEKHQVKLLLAKLRGAKSCVRLWAMASIWGTAAARPCVAAGSQSGLNAAPSARTGIPYQQL